MNSKLHRIIRTATFSVFGALIAAHLAVGSDTTPRRPTSAFALYRGDMAPVVGADAQRPFVMVGEKEVRSDVPVTVAIGLGKHFSPGNIEVSNDPVTGWAMTDQGAVINPDTETINFRGDLTSDIDLEDVYVVVLVYSANADLTQPVRFYGIVSEVDRLEVGKKKAYQAAMFPIKEPGTWRSTMLVFSDGLEVPTNLEGVVINQHLDALDRATLAQKIEKRIAGGDAALALERNFPIQLSDELRSAYTGQTVKVRLEIGTDGNVNSAELAEVEDADLQEAISSQLAHWLFLPSVKNGEAVSQTVVLPVKF